MHEQTRRPRLEPSIPSNRNGDSSFLMQRVFFPQAGADPALKYAAAFRWKALLTDPERLQLPMQRRALHADEFGGARDVSGESADLGDQVVALEHFPRLA